MVGTSDLQLVDIGLIPLLSHIENGFSRSSAWRSAPKVSMEKKASFLVVPLGKAYDVILHC